MGVVLGRLRVQPCPTFLQPQCSLNLREQMLLSPHGLGAPPQVSSGVHCASTPKFPPPQDSSCLAAVCLCVLRSGCMNCSRRF